MTIVPAVMSMLGHRRGGCDVGWLECCPMWTSKGNHYLTAGPKVWTQARSTMCSCRRRRQRGPELTPAPFQPKQTSPQSFIALPGAPVYTVPVQTGKRLVISGVNSGAGKEVGDASRPRALR